MSPSWLRLVSDNEQDRASAEKWWRETPDADKCMVWDVIQKLGEANPLMDLVSRFAQLGFAELCERMEAVTTE